MTGVYTNECYKTRYKKTKEKFNRITGEDYEDYLDARACEKAIDEFIADGEKGTSFEDFKKTCDI